MSGTVRILINRREEAGRSIRKINTQRKPLDIFSLGII